MPTTLRLVAISATAAAALAPGVLAQDVQPRMGDPVPGLTGPELQRFLDGLAEFEFALTEADGLGPIFNDSSCAQCHSFPAVGGASTRDVTRFGVAASGPNPFDPLAALGGSLLQDTIIASAPQDWVEVVPPEADVAIQRITPHTFGSGLVEAIPDAAIEANAIAPPHPSVQGEVRWVDPLEGGGPRAGRFGWKGGVATVLTFSADASLNEMGLTNRFLDTENAPNGDPVKLAGTDFVADPEDSLVAGDGRIDRQTDFQRYLAAPPQTPREGMAGEAVFESVGCAACHVPSFTTGFAPEPALSNVEIRPYSDFLLHDMGALGDGIVDGPATEEKMMTRALWGLGFREAFLHDGRATGGGFAGNVDAAILEHDGEAAFARDAYALLPQPDKDALAAFLRSLGRSEFDVDNSNTVDVFDWFFLDLAFTGPVPAQPLTPDDEGAIGDVDVDGDLDLADFLVLQRAFTGQ